MNEATVHIVAGDAMLALFRERYPELEAIPFREDLSKGSCEWREPCEEMIEKRAAFWGVTPKEYEEKLAPIIDLDISRDIVLNFGEDDCCRANLKFMTGLLKARGYSRPILVRIVNEYDLTLLREYFA